MVNTELYHHGIKGQKWGRRRFQKRDGTLTPAGKKRYANEYTRLREEKKILNNKKKTNAKIQKLEDMKKANEELRKEVESSDPTKKTKTKVKTESKPEPDKPKTVKDLSTEELRAQTERMRAERDYITAQMELSRLQPQKVSKGKEFAKKVLVDKVLPAAGKYAQKKAEDYIKKKLGIGESEAERLKKESERLKREADDWTNKQRADQAKEYFRQKEKDPDKTSNAKKDDEPETVNVNVNVSGKDVTGEGTSKFTGWASAPPKDVVWDGQRYVDELLGLPGPTKRVKHSDDEDSDELYHYGVKGMKWGVRKDKVSVKGLSRQKRKLIEEGTSLFPRYKGKFQPSYSKHVVNRNRVADDLFQEEIIRKQKALIQQLSKGKKNVTLDKNVEREIDDKLRKEFISRYADATLKDLNIKRTPEIKAYTEDLIRDDVKVFMNY